jgi:hypothetical protein
VGRERISSRSPARLRGFLLVAMSVLLVMVGTTVAAYLLNSAKSKAERSGYGQQSQLVDISLALSAYVTANKRLPCPADGSRLAATGILVGKEIRDSTTGICTSSIASVNNQQTGIVPWLTLGLSEDRVRAPDLTYYSYRVFSGPTGLTVADGLDMAPCDTDNGPTVDTPLNAYKCTDDNSTVAQFVSGKGLTVVTDSPQPDANIAYVVIHHGKNGSGAFLSSGVQKPVTSASVISEYANTLGTDGGNFGGTFHAKSPKTDVDETAATYFDDRVIYKSIPKLAAEAGIGPRNWLDTPSTVTLTGAAVTLAGDEKTATFADGTISAGGATDSTIVKATTGLGVAGTGGGGDQVRGNDKLSFSFYKDISTIGLIFNSLAMQSGKYEGVTGTLINAIGGVVGTLKFVACDTATDDNSSTYVYFDMVSIGKFFRSIELSPNVLTDTAVHTDTDFYLYAISSCDGSGASCLPSVPPGAVPCTFAAI